MGSMTLSEELTWRGFINQTTYDDIKSIDNESISFYFGVDPSADSMTIGNLASAMMVKHFINHGHKATLLVGGATGMIGDPDGKKQERDLKTLEEIEHNKQSIANEYRNIFEGQSFDIVDNYDWFKNINYLDFLRQIGKHVPMRTMLGRDFVQSRLSEDGAGISYAEFSYSLIQGYDFLHLYRERGITLQISGADQWGNSIAGVELIRRVAGGEAHIWTAPLIVNKTTGVKFGKSEDGAVWLNSEKTSPYKFYQFWLNCDDEGVIDYLKIYTLLSPDEIEEISRVFNEDRSSRIAQKTLAFEVTKLVHGETKAKSIKRISEVLFGNETYDKLTSEDFIELKNELPVAKAKLDQTPIYELLVSTSLANSNSEARRFLDNNAIYINGQQIPLSKSVLDSNDDINGHTLIRRGKNNQAVIELN